jgi:GNAT superfamily N-acetyltransferase
LPIEIRRLEKNGSAVVAALATYPGEQERTELLEDPRTFFLAAFDAERPAGFVLAHELLRRHGSRSILFVYEVDVDPAYRRQGIGTSLMAALERLARERGIDEAFVLTETDNREAMPFYGSLGGTQEDVVMWTFGYPAN